VKSISRPDTLETSTMDPTPDFSSAGIAAFTARTLCIMSTLKPACHAASSSATASAETLATTMSMPPSAVSDWATQPSSAALSATSTASP
jgi:hypothetical protein